MRSDLAHADATPPIRLLLRMVLPHRDPISRKRVRRAATNLVTIDNWSGDDATNEELAQLALVRLLWLQRECRRAARRGHTEAAVLVSRTAIETLIVGMWMLHASQPITALRGQSAKSLKSLISFASTAGLVPTPLLKAMIQTVGEPRPLPTLRSLIDQLKDSQYWTELNGLYEHFYQPLSSLFGHGSPAALLRHVDADGRVVTRPMMPWSSSRATHAADACVGMLAGAIALQIGAPAGALDRYTRAHRDRMVVPGAIMAVKGAPRAIRWSALPSVVPDITAMRRIWADRLREDRSDPTSGVPGSTRPSSVADQDAELTRHTEKVVRAMYPTVDDETRAVMITGLVESLLDTAQTD